MTLDHDTRGAVRRFLPDALLRAMTSYERFSRRVENEGDLAPVTPRDFSGTHQACRMAVAHIELLIKLAERVADAGEGRGGLGDPVLAELLSVARADVAAFHANSGGEDGDETEGDDDGYE